MSDLPEPSETQETPEPIWMRCPYDAELCGAEATLSQFTASDSEGWSGRLECANGHRFRISQEPIEESGEL